MSNLKNAVDYSNAKGKGMQYPQEKGFTPMMWKGWGSDSTGGSKKGMGSFGVKTPKYKCPNCK